MGPAKPSRDLLLYITVTVLTVFPFGTIHGATHYGVLRFQSEFWHHSNRDPTLKKNGDVRGRGRSVRAGLKEHTGRNLELYDVD